MLLASRVLSLTSAHVGDASLLVPEASRTPEAKTCRRRPSRRLKEPCLLIRPAQGLWLLPPPLPRGQGLPPFVPAPAVRNCPSGVLPGEGIDLRRPRHRLRHRCAPRPGRSAPRVSIAGQLLRTEWCFPAGPSPACTTQRRWNSVVSGMAAVLCRDKAGHLTLEAACGARYVELRQRRWRHRSVLTVEQEY